MTTENIPKNSRKPVISAVLYGIAGVISAGTGGALVATNHLPVLGVTLILAGISAFGWSCFARDWFFKPKNISVDKNHDTNQSE